MLRSIFILIVLSLLVFLGMNYFHLFLDNLIALHHFVLTKITGIIPGTGIVTTVIDLLALLIIPIAIAFVPAFFYWLFTRREMPWMTEIIWLVWAMLVTCIGLQK